MIRTGRRHAIGALAAAALAPLGGRRGRAQEGLDLEAAVFDDPDTPVLGNPSGDVPVVEFFDYRCPYCRRSARGLHDLIAEDSGVRLLMKEWPILGRDSVEAARGALAAHRQGRYGEVHWRLMLEEGDVGRERLWALASELGLDLARFEADVESDLVAAAIARNDAVATALGFTGTPAFIVGRALVPGAVSSDVLRELVAKARSET
jgi:protein-disulfide isomerase